MTIYRSLRRLFHHAEEAPDTRDDPRTHAVEDELRRHAEQILQAAVAAVEPEARVVEALERRAAKLAPHGRLWLAGFGKAASAMAHGALQVLGERIAGGVLIVPPGTEHEAPAEFETFGGGHPIPDHGGVAGADAIRRLAREATERDLLLCLVSGGGSAMLTLPPDGLPIEDVQEVTALLLEAGAEIGDLNCVRKHLDVLKGGRLACEASPAAVLALVLSDVIDDRLDVIASGPVSPDATRFADAVAVLRKYGVWKRTPLAARGYLDRGISGEIKGASIVGDPCFERVKTVVVGNGRLAAQAACREAERLGYDPQLLSTTLTGEARDAGNFLSVTARALLSRPREPRTPICVVTAGETTVTVRGDGRGGRNQELVLGAAPGIDGLGPALVASMGTDGIDGPTDAAGGVVTSTTLRRARDAGLDLTAALARNDAHSVLAALDDLIVSGPTGTNVADIQVMLLG